MTEVFKPNRKIAPHELVTGEAARMVYVANPEKGTALEEMLDPRYWASVARNLRPRDRIEVWAHDNSWFAEIVVLVVEPYAVKVQVLHAERFGVPEAQKIAETPDGYTIRHRGRYGWSIIRDDDGSVLASEQGSREAAQAWLNRHLAVLGEKPAAA